MNTNPLFNNLATFLSSDYLLNGLNLSPSQIGERLGDGFYEQQFIQNEVLSLTGNEFLPGYGDNQDEFKGLMESGETYASQFNLTLGVGLTAAQMAQLTSNMVWLVWENVDGQQVLVPQLYLAQNQSSLTDSGAVISGYNVNINGNTTNNGVIQAGDQLQITGTDVNNSGSIVSGGNMLINISGDLSNNSGTIYGGGDVGIAANNVLDQTVSTPVVGAVGASTVYATGVIGSGGNLTIDASGTANLVAAQLDASNALNINANTVNIGSATDSQHISSDYTASGGNFFSSTTTHETLNSTQTTSAGSTLSGGTVNINSVGDTTITGSAIVGAGDVSILAGGNLTVDSSQNTSSYSATKDTTTNGFSPKLRTRAQG